MSQSQFDFDRSQHAKSQGMALAAANRDEQLAYARAIAVDIALSREDRCCWADLVQRRLLAEGVDLGPASGSIFAGKRWVHSGRYIKSKRIANHAREQKVWRLVEN